MTIFALPALATLAIAVTATAGVILRPWKLPEAIWAVAGASILLLTGLLPWGQGLHAVIKGLDVYLFLTGMMLLSEIARREGLFDYLASHAAQQAKGSARRLFALIYATGTLVTIFMSNDATAVVLTPAVFAAARKVGAKPLPYLFICALIANAASFVLPISNPANLVLFNSQTPPLLAWLGRFALPSVVSITVTFLLLRFSQRNCLREKIQSVAEIPALARTGKIAAGGIVMTSLALMAASTLGLQLGWPTFAAGGLTALAVLIVKRERPWPLLSDISWQVLPLVAGLFVLVEGLDHIGLIRQLAGHLTHDSKLVDYRAGIGIALASNLTNNLPAGLIAGTAITDAHAPGSLASALLIGVDLGPNLSITGSLATILWLTALRREGEHVSAWAFLKLGMLLMPAALLPALGVLLALS
jgi:arsenical pump membrane protein